MATAGDGKELRATGLFQRAAAFALAENGERKRRRRRFRPSRPTTEKVGFSGHFVTKGCKVGHPFVFEIGRSRVGGKVPNEIRNASRPRKAGRGRAGRRDECDATAAGKQSARAGPNHRLSETHGSFSANIANPEITISQQKRHPAKPSVDTA